MPPTLPLGYLITTAVLLSAACLIALIANDRRELHRLLKGSISRVDAVLLVFVLAFFVIFSLLFVTPTEQLYFDESIYQGIALNVLQHGTALWCQYGTAHLTQCFSNQIYHDPVGWSVLLAIPFALFGPSIGTAYGTELFIGAMSIVGIFLLSGMISKRKGFPVTSAFIMALMPPLFIWSRTQAVIDLPFMTLSIFTFFFFVLFTKKPNLKTLSIFLSCLSLTVYMRLEATLLIPIFVVLFLFFSDKGMRKTIAARIKLVRFQISNNTWPGIVLVLFMLLILPEIYYIAQQAQNPNYGQSSTQQLFSLQNLRNNSVTNAQYLLGNYDVIQNYPEIFSWPLTILAIMGIVLMIYFGREKNKYGLIALAGIWFSAYFLFYGFFYAGAATFGVDSRFMLQLLPSMVIFATFGVFGLAGCVSRYGRRELASIVYSASLLVFIIFPFIYLAPLITLTQHQMPQQHGISTAVNFIYANYTRVPSNCLVFSFTPDIWYELNRSSAQIGLMGTNTINSSRFSCFVLDYGYWCNVPPYESSTCKSDLSRYNLSVIATMPSGLANNVTLYYINNYTG